VSENDDVTSQAQQHSHGKQCMKRCVLRRLQKTGSDCVDVTCCGRLLQTWAAATRRAQLPMVNNRVQWMTNDNDELWNCQASITLHRADCRQVV